MSKENGDKVQRAQTYLALIEQRQKSGTISAKHSKSKGAEESYRQWLDIEQRKAKAKLNRLLGVA